MTKTLTLGGITIRPHGTRYAMHVKHRLERVLATPDIYNIEVGSGCAIIDPPSLDATDLERIQTVSDISVYYIREDGIRVA